MILATIAKSENSFTVMYHLSLIFRILRDYILHTLYSRMTHRITHNNTSKVLFIARYSREMFRN